MAESSRVIDKRQFFDWIGYTPHPKQWLFHDSQARFRIACCGRRYGKSTMAARDLAPGIFLPDKRYWIVGPTYDLGEKEFRVVWNDLMRGKLLIKDKRIRKGYNKKQGDMFIEMPWGTRLEVRSADHPDNLVGEALDGCIISEAAKQKEETWKRFVRPALADKRGWATFPSTPEGFNWYYDLWQLGQDPNERLYESWSFPSWDNTAVYPEGRSDPEIQELERNTVPEWFAQEIGAEFSAFVGKIYGEFDESVHVTDLEFIPNLPNYLAIDWGFANPAAWVEFQVTPNDEIRVWRLHYKPWMTVDDHIQFFKNRTDNPPGYHLDLAFADAADPEAAETVSRHLVPCIADPDAKTNWRQGVDLVKRFLKVEEKPVGSSSNVIVGTGMKKVTHFFLDRHRCKEAIVEFNNYRSKAPVNGNNVPEVGQKAKDHFLDAIRYGLVHLYELGVNYHLADVMEVANEAIGRAWEQRNASIHADAWWNQDEPVEIESSEGSGVWVPDHAYSEAGGDGLFFSMTGKTF